MAVHCGGSLHRRHPHRGGECGESCPAELDTHPNGPVETRQRHSRSVCRLLDRQTGVSPGAAERNVTTPARSASRDCHGRSNAGCRARVVAVAGCVTGLFLGVLMWAAFMVVAFWLTVVAKSVMALPVSAAAEPFRAQLTREVQARFGVPGPVPVLAAQIEQESGWRPGVTAWDNGRGLGQFMDGTAKWLVSAYPFLGVPDPYNPTWAMRAMVQLNLHNLQRVKGKDSCESWGAALKAYNAGLGYVRWAQERSPEPARWFGATEWVRTNQTPANFEASRQYPRRILFQRQPTYRAWGALVCL